MQNLVLMRARTRGVNFGGAPTNAVSDFDPPYFVQLMLNTAYNEFLSRTNTFPIATLEVFTPSVAAAQTISLKPIPANGGTINPAALRVYEMTYTQAGAQERYVPIIGTPRFRDLTGGYLSRFGVQGVPRAACQQFGQRTLDVFPSVATAGDTIKLTICPDPQSSPAACPCSSGGIMANNADVPLIPPQFHNALVEYALSKVCDAANKTFQRDAALAAFEKYVNDAMEFAGSYGEGDAEQRVEDSWPMVLP